MKSLIKWSLLNNLDILPKQELDWIEYKGRRAIDISIDGISEDNVKNTLSKAISAFSNSGGGYLVLGINDSTYSIDDGGIFRFIKHCGTKSWLEDIIPTVVNPTLIDFNVIEILSEQISEIINNERGIYIIEINDSKNAPHQAKDNKYYGRIGGKSKPLSHRFVMDIIGRRVNPIIKPWFCLESEGDKVYLNIFLQNDGNVMGNYVSGWAKIPKYLIPETLYKDNDIEEINNQKYYRFFIENRKKEVIGIDRLNSIEYAISRYVPILRGVCFFIRLNLKHEPFEKGVVGLSGEKILWELAVDNAPMTTGEVLFSDILKQSKKFDNLNM